MFVDIYSTDRKYGVIYADPPWSYNNQGNGAAKKHYNTMTKHDIFDLPVSELAADNCALFLWVTFPNLEQGLETMRRWGFKYKTIGFNWVKRNRSGKGWFWGLGFWTRSNSEACLIGVKGKPKRISAGVHSVIETPIEAHSKKPDEARARIVELMGGGVTHRAFCTTGRRRLGLLGERGYGR